MNVKLLSCVQLFTIPWTVACQAPLSMGILQARILKWVAISFSRTSSWSRDWTWVSCIVGRLFTLCATRELYTTFLYSSVSGHLGCFHVLAVVNSTAVNIGIHVFFWIMVSSAQWLLIRTNKKDLHYLWEIGSPGESSGELRLPCHSFILQLNLIACQLGSLRRTIRVKMSLCSLSLII